MSNGSAYILNQVVKALIDAGCRQAQPGEYTQRAYLNGKMDLSRRKLLPTLSLLQIVLRIKWH